MADVTTSSMNDARDAEDTRLLEAREHRLLVDGYASVIIGRCRAADRRLAAAVRGALLVA